MKLRLFLAIPEEAGNKHGIIIIGIYFCRVSGSVPEVSPLVRELRAAGGAAGGPGGAGGAGGLVSNLHTLLNDGHHDARWELVYMNIALTIFMSL